MTVELPTTSFPAVDLLLKIIESTDKDAAVRELHAYFEELGVEGVIGLVQGDNQYRHPYNWVPLDQLYMRARAALMQNITWANGPSKMVFTFDIYRNGLRGYDVTGRTVVDFGCGALHPHNISALFYLNGAARCFAVDMAPLQSSEVAARSLYELLIDGISEPTRWLLPGVDSAAFAARIGTFDIAALHRGDLSAGVAKAPIVHHVGLIQDLFPERDSVDLMVSSTVLEHVHRLDDLCRFFHRIMAPAGLSYHNVDYTDHSVHADPTKNYWSFMTEGGEIPDDGDINKLRYSEVENLFREAGFDVINDPLFRRAPPDEVVNALLPQYRDLSTDDLEMLSSGLYLTKRAETVEHLELDDLS